MQINYDKAKIEAALNHFTNATGINVKLIKSDFSSLDINCCTNSYCEIIHSTKEGKNRCLNSDKALLTKCSLSRHPETHLCHAGLIDVAVPIILEDDILGYLILGQMKENKPFSSVEKQLKDLSLDMRMISKKYDELAIFNPSKIESIVSVSEMLAKFILFENSLKPRFDYSVQSAVEYINTHLNEALSIKHLTVKCGVSKNTLYRGFKKEFGITIGEYITKKRLEEACELLSTTNLSVEQIAEQIGFSTASYLSAIFKKNKGISPLRFRKTAQSYSM